MLFLFLLKLDYTSSVAVYFSFITLSSSASFLLVFWGFFFVGFGGVCVCVLFFLNNHARPILYSSVIIAWVATSLAIIP